MTTILVEHLDAKPDWSGLPVLAHTEREAQVSATGKRLGPIDALLTSVATWITPTMAGGMPASFSLYRLADEPGTWQVGFSEDVREVRARTTADTRTAAGGLIVDARAGRESLELELDGRPYRLELGPDGVTIHSAEVSTALSDAVAAAAAYVSPVVHAPDLSALCGDYAVEPWLASLYDTLVGQASNLSRAAAVGAVASHWTPVGRDQLRRAYEDARSGRDTPALRAIAWSRSLPETTREGLARDVASAVPVLLADLEHLRDDLIHGRDTDALGLALLHRRDDLQCVAFLLKAAKSGEGIAEALASFDTAAARLHAVWSNIHIPDDPRLERARESLDRPWWGVLLGER